MRYIVFVVRRVGISALITAGHTSDLVSFPPLFLSHLQAYHEGSVVVVSMSSMETYLPGIKTASRNKKQGNKQKFPSGFSILAEVRGPGNGSGSQTPTCLNSRSAPLSGSITDLSSWWEFPSGQQGHSGRAAEGHRTPVPSFSLPAASTSPTPQFTPSGFPPPPPKPHHNHRISDYTTQRNFKDLQS